MMHAHELAQVRTLREAYGQAMTNGYSHDHAVRMLMEAYRAKMSDAVLARGLWLDSATPWCDAI